VFAPADKVNWPGGSPSPVQACAWSSLLALTTGKNPNYVAWADRECSRLSASNQTAARQRLRAIAQSLDLDAAPPKGWHPVIAGLLPDQVPAALRPDPSIDTRCLDSTVCPLSAGPDDKHMPHLRPAKRLPRQPLRAV
jgi:hypothetical protein